MIQPMEDIYQLGLLKNTDQAVISTMKHLTKPISLTSITTMSAFLTLLLSPLEGMGGYGSTIAFGIGWAWFLSLTFLPALISLLKWDSNSKAIAKPSFIESIMYKFGNLSTK